MDELQSQFSNPIKVFREVCEKEKAKVSKEIENLKNETEKMKEFLVEETKQMFQRNKRNFKEIEDFTGFKYKVELLQNSDRDHKTLRDSLGLGSETVSYSGLQNVVEFQIYRVKESGAKVNERKTSNGQSLLLLHGTKVSNVEGILKEGLKPSQTGRHGPGVYLTNSVTKASEYGECFVSNNGFHQNMIYMFIIKLKIPNSSLIKDFKYKQDNVNKERKVSFASRNPTYENGKKRVYSNYLLSRFEKDRDNMKIYENEPPIYKLISFYKPKLSTMLSTNAILDSNNDKILKGTFTVGGSREIRILSHHDLVTPAYIVKVEVKKDLRENVKKLLYKKFNVSEHNKTTDTMLQPRKLCKDSIIQISSNKESTYSAEMFIDELKREIEANQHAQIELLESQFFHKNKFLIPQLTFEMSSLFDSLKDNSLIYKTVLLESTDKDYEFLRRSLNDKGCANVPKVLHMFRIISADQTDVENFYNNYLYLQGTTADKVMNILKQGYPKSNQSLFSQHNKYCFMKKSSKKCSCYSSGWLDLELKKGLSYCKVGDEVTELSFVFVASDVHLKNSIVPSEVPLENLDSRRCRFDPDFCSPKSITLMVPAYLIVFSL